MTGDLGTRLAQIDARIADASRAAGRNAEEIQRIVVTKFHPAELISQLYALGVRDVGENRQQELSGKREALADLDEMRWHFIGQAQSNKARQIRAAATVVHSVDRIKLADALHAAARADDPTDVLDVLVQVNLTDDPARGGSAPADLERLAEHVLNLPSLRLRGLMAVAPLEEAPAAAFERLAGIAERLRAVHPEARWLSAGMSHDFAEAITHGATHLRIGSAITGERPARG